MKLLTDRERLVMDQMVDGAMNKTIAAELGSASARLRHIAQA